MIDFPFYAIRSWRNVSGGSASMKNFRIESLLGHGFVSVLLVFLIVMMSAPPSFARGARGLATITGTVRDNKGAPLAGAVIQLMREGAKAIVKQTYSGRDGSFTAKIPAGRYSLRAIADGFSEVLFSSVTVSPSEEIIYRFNLEPVGSGRTLVEQRADRDSVKWRLRAAQSHRSIFQANEGDNPTIARAEAARGSDETPEAANGPGTDEKGGRRIQAVMETYFAGS